MRLYQIAVILFLTAVDFQAIGFSAQPCQNKQHKAIIDRSDQINPMDTPRNLDLTHCSDPFL